MSRMAVICVLGVPILSGCVGGYKPDLNSPDPAARIRAIRQTTERAERTSIPLLVDRLEDEDEAVRFYAINALIRLTGRDMGYKYYKSAHERLAAVKRWRRYVRQESSAGATTQAADSRR